MSQPDAPQVSAFQCPHKFQCLEREVLRFLIMVACILLARYLPGCAACKIEGPGVTITCTPVWPSAKQIEAAQGEPSPPAATRPALAAR